MSTDTLEPEIVTVELDRQCATCGEMRPTTEFRDAPGAPLFASCRKCRKGELALLDQRGKQVKNLAKQLVAEARGEYIKSPHITEINAEMFKQAGGVKEFCELWWEQIKEAIVTKAGSRTVLDQFTNISKLAKAATELRDSAPDVSYMTDEELGQEMLKLAKNVAELQGPEQCPS
ncbi:MAG: hypothetical protein U9Q82_11295 [Chloroflexota bacterium]|nr:hypothetical protein [Chloroflexota bacterium]